MPDHEAMRTLVPDRSMWLFPDGINRSPEALNFRRCAAVKQNGMRNTDHGRNGHDTAMDILCAVTDDQGGELTGLAGNEVPEVDDRFTRH